MNKCKTFDVGIRFQGLNIAVVRCQNDTFGEEVKVVLRQERPEFKEGNISLYFSGHEITDHSVILDKILNTLKQYRIPTDRIGIFQELTQSPLCFLSMKYEEKERNIIQENKVKQEKKYEEQGNKVEQEKKREEQAWRGGQQGGIRIIIHHITDISFELFADPLDTVQDLKYQVQKLQKMPVSKQGMIYCGTSLVDDLSLADAGLVDNSDIWIMCL